jgi:hypothetical protein
VPPKYRGPQPYSGNTEFRVQLTRERNLLRATIIAVSCAVLALILGGFVFWFAGLIMIIASVVPSLFLWMRQQQEDRTETEEPQYSTDFSSDSPNLAQEVPIQSPQNLSHSEHLIHEDFVHFPSLKETIQEARAAKVAREQAAELARKEAELKARQAKERADRQRELQRERAYKPLIDHFNTLAGSYGDFICHVMRKYWISRALPDLPIKLWTAVPPTSCTWSISNKAQADAASIARKQRWFPSKTPVQLEDRYAELYVTLAVHPSISNTFIGSAIIVDDKTGGYSISDETGGYSISDETGAYYAWDPFPETYKLIEILQRGTGIPTRVPEVPKPERDNTPSEIRRLEQYSCD